MHYIFSDLIICFSQYKLAYLLHKGIAKLAPKSCPKCHTKLKIETTLKDISNFIDEETNGAEAVMTIKDTSEDQEMLDAYYTDVIGVDVKENRGKAANLKKEILSQKIH